MSTKRVNVYLCSNVWRIEDEIKVLPTAHCNENVFDAKKRGFKQVCFNRSSQNLLLKTQTFPDLGTLIHHNFSLENCLSYEKPETAMGTSVYLKKLRRTFLYAVYYLELKKLF